MPRPPAPASRSGPARPAGVHCVSASVSRTTRAHRAGSAWPGPPLGDSSSTNKTNKPEGEAQKAKNPKLQTSAKMNRLRHAPMPTPAELEEVFRNDHAGTFLATDGRMFLKSVRSADSCFLFPFIQAGTIRQVRSASGCSRARCAHSALTASSPPPRSPSLRRSTFRTSRSQRSETCRTSRPTVCPGPTVYSLYMVFHSMRMYEPK